MSYKIGLIGAGYWGKNLLRVFSELQALKVVCDTDKDILEKRKKQYPGIEFSSDLSEVLKKEINAVVIASPVGTHYEIAKKCLESKKDVFVEKPLALKLDQGQELVDLAQKNNLILMVGHLLHYHPAIVKLKEVINRGELGSIRYIWSNRLNFGKLRPEENVLWSFAPHDISLILNILGEPKKVSAMGRAYLKQDVPDTTLSVLEYGDNLAAHIFVSWLNPFKEQKLSVIGSEKMAVFDGINNELIIYSHKINFKKDKGYEAIKAEGETMDFENKEALMEEAKHFLDCIEQRKTPKTDGKEGLRVLRILDLCQKSLNIREKGEYGS